MPDDDSNASRNVESWDTYWHGARQNAAYTGGGSSHPAVLAFWDEFFGDVRQHFPRPRLVDIASGNGAVAERAAAVLGETLAEITCLDTSAAAIEALTRRFPQVSGIVADARSIPLESATCDVATSQFGIEYAGLEALDEAGRLLTPGGRLALLLHHRSGGIYRQCAASLDAIEKMRKARFIPLASALFEAAFATLRGGDRCGVETAGKRFTPALRTMESIMRQHGTGVADGTIVRLYRDVRRIHDSLSRYEPTEVLQWLGKLQDEVRAYAGRMASMCDVAIDEATFAELTSKLRDERFGILRGDALLNAERVEPLAWALVAEKPGD